MGLFFGKRNQLLKVLEWVDDTKNTLVYRYPMDGDQIMYGSKLTVRESQTAIFLNKGQIADVFKPGMYKLSASNLPILTKLLSLPYGFKSPFQADVFYVSTKQFANQKWGTASPITMRDKEFGTVRIRSYGSYSFRVSDPVVFLKEIYGTNSLYKTEDIESYLRSMIIAHFTDVIAESKISALDMACNQSELSKIIKEQLQSKFAAIGLSLANFIIENISFPEAIEKAIDERASKGVLSDSMDSYIKYQTAKAIGEAAKNPGAGGIGATLGAGMAIGDIVRDSMANGKAAKEQAKKVCPECGVELKKTAKFCSECGHKFAPEKKVCPDCKTEMRGSAKFCPECGKKMGK